MSQNLELKHLPKKIILILADLLYIKFRIVTNAKETCILYI